MRTTLLIVSLLFSLTVAQTQNLYQSCSNAYGSPFYLDDALVYFDWANLTLPFDQAYSLQTEFPTGTFYFNVCAGTSKCDGAMACFLHRDGRQKVYATPNFSGNYFVNYAHEVEVNFYSAYGFVFSLELSCNSSAIGININDYETYFDDFTIYGNSAFACAIQDALPVYKAPTYYSSFSAPIYMSGRIPFFYNADSNRDDVFVGTIYYSASYGLLINGTLNNIETVAFYYSTTIPGYEPGVVFNFVADRGCNLLPYPNTNDYLKDIFSAESNPQIGITREYTSIYYNQGETFQVNGYAQSLGSNYNQLRIIQRADNGLPVYIGAFLLDPWMSSIISEHYWIGSYDSEINWNQISTYAPESIFTPPTEYGCPFNY